MKFLLLSVVLALAIAYSYAQLQYVGCFLDKEDDRAFKVGPRKDNVSLTVQNCMTTCADYRFSGLQFGYECWCTDTGFDKHGAAESQDNCDMFCSGDPGERLLPCGGGFVNSVYLNDK